MTTTATGTEANSSCQRPPLTPMSWATCGVATPPICQPCCECPSITSGETRMAPTITATQNRFTSSSGEPSGASRPPGSCLTAVGRAVAADAHCALEEIPEHDDQVTRRRRTARRGWPRPRPRGPPRKWPSGTSAAAPWRAGTSGWRAPRRTSRTRTALPPARSGTRSGSGRRPARSRARRGRRPAAAR